MDRSTSPAALGLAVLVSAQAVMAFSCEDTESDVLANDRFDEWCGDRLCDWTLESGAVEPVPTWHERELGVRFAATDTAISQLIPNGASCFRFDVLADIEARAGLFFELDFLDDGTVEYRQPILGQRFELVTSFLRPPDWFEALRLRIVLDAPGEARLARLRMRSVSLTECRGDPIQLLDRPLDAGCETDEVCASGVCVGGFCGGCSRLHPCDSGEACAIEVLEEPPYQRFECREAGSTPEGGDCIVDEACGFGGCRNRRCSCTSDDDCREGELCGWNPPEPGAPVAACQISGGASLGRRCFDDAECATGICCEGRCSTCCPEDAPCPTGTCEEGDFADRDLSDPDLWNDAGILPFQCDPGRGNAASGDACLVDADCTSGRCRGLSDQRTCLDGTSCEDGLDCGVPTCFPIGRLDGVCE